jgi:putative endonuclease
MKIDTKATTTDIGRMGENAACNYLKSQKYKIIEQNYFASHNEIDIIAENKQYIVFVEVKTRSCDDENDLIFGTPSSAVTYSKQKRTIAAAQNYLKIHPTSKGIRLDVIEVYLKKSGSSHELLRINHMENAFGN